MAADTKGSHDATAKAAPAAAAETAVRAVWVVPNMPWIRPTSDGSEPWVSRDCSDGSAAANPRASVPPSTMRAGTRWMNGYEAQKTMASPRPPSTSRRRSMWSASHPLGREAMTKGTANRVHETPICQPAAPRDSSSRVQQMS